MNREIKFRAWNTGIRMNRGMYSWEEMIDSLDSEINPYKSLFAPFLQSEQFKENPWIILMQYTGLKDKNGTEIYEGDIVETFDGYRGGKGEVKWFAEWEGAWFYGYYLVNGNNPQYRISFPQMETKFIEVIGNIYENPELLKNE